jgi:cytochrome c oxidase subunit II
MSSILSGFPRCTAKWILFPATQTSSALKPAMPGCSVDNARYCGAQHAHMRLLVIAQQPDEYQAWLDQQRKPAAEPTTQDAIAGEQVFLASPCILCHQVRGTTAGGTVAT